MTIIETLCNIARNNALIFTEEEQEAMAEAIVNIQELNWYKEQDFIRREDVIPIPIYCTHGMGECAVTYTCPKCWEETIMQIPKAEPPVKAIYSNKPIIVHNKEDWDRFQADISECKTCKHDETGDGYCRDCGTTINHYEPYIPKE